PARVRLSAPGRRGLDLAGAAAGRLHAAGLRPRRRPARPGPIARGARAAACPRRWRDPAVAAARRLQPALPPPPRRPALADLGLVRRRRSRGGRRSARPAPGAAPRARRPAGRRGRGAVRPAGRDPRLLALEHPRGGPQAAARAARDGPAGAPARPRRRLRGRDHGLRARRGPARLRQRDSARAQQRHPRQPPGPARPRRAPLLHKPRPALRAAPLRRRLAPGRPQVRRQEAVQAAARVDGWAVRSVPGAMKVLLVTMYFPPAGGGGVQRPLKTATHLPALGIETHVLAPDDPKWLHRDDDLRPPTQAFVHRARYLGPRARLPSEELHGLEGGERMLAQAKLAYRRALLPDASVTWLPTAVPAAVRLVRREGIDAVITTSPPNSMNLIGAAVKRLTGIPWIA